MIYVLRYLAISLYTLFWGPIASVLGLLGRSEAVVWVGRNWVHWILRTCGIRVEASGLENLDPAQPYIFMSNHQSAVDIAAIIETMPRTFRFVAKKELTRIPVFGQALALSGQIIIDRQNREKAIRSLDRAREKIHRDRLSVIVYPEGTRSPSGSLGEFKSGGFHLAVAAGVPVIPVSVSGSHHITPKRSLRVESGRVRIHYGRPIPTEKLAIEDRGKLKEQVREAILQGFDPDLQGEVEPGLARS